MFIRTTIRSTLLRRTRRTGIVAMTALTSFLLCASTAPDTCKPPPSHTGAEAAGIAAVAGAAIGVVVLVEVHKSHHTIKGCVSQGPDGIEVLNQSDNKTYSVSGVTAHVKIGDVVQLHGVKEKHAKGSGADPSFVVEKMSRDYGPCKLAKF